MFTQRVCHVFDFIGFGCYFYYEAVHYFLVFAQKSSAWIEKQKKPRRGKT